MQNDLRWTEASDVIPMFPTFAWKVQVEASLRDALRERILAALAGTRGAERISISFNVLFSSFAERMSKPLW